VSDDPVKMTIQEREISGVENLKKHLVSSLENDFAAHYSMFASMTWLRISLRILLKGSQEDYEKAATLLAEEWGAVAERDLYPKFCKMRMGIEAQLPEKLEDMDWDQLFKDTVSDNKAYIYGSLMEEQSIVEDFLLSPEDAN